MKIIFNDYYLNGCGLKENIQINKFNDWYSIYLFKCIWIRIFNSKLIKFIDWLISNKYKKNKN